MSSDEERLTVVNVVASTRVAEELNLPDIAIQLNCEYEPEQFPGVVYRVINPKLAILMFRSGRAVCTGGKNEGNIHAGIQMMIADLVNSGITTWSLSPNKDPVRVMASSPLPGKPTYNNKDWYADEAFVLKAKEKRKKIEGELKSKMETVNWRHIEDGSKSASPATLLRGGVGATLTSRNKTLTVDGVKLAVGDRLLVAGEENSTHNGIYVVTSLGPTVLTRSEDCDNLDEEDESGVPKGYPGIIGSRKVATGMLVPITEGKEHAGEIWILEGTHQIALGVTPGGTIQGDGTMKFSLDDEVVTDDVVVTGSGMFSITLTPESDEKRRVREKKQLIQHEIESGLSKKKSEEAYKTARGDMHREKAEYLLSIMDVKFGGDVPDGEGGLNEEKAKLQHAKDIIEESLSGEIDKFPCLAAFKARCTRYPTYAEWFKVTYATSQDYTLPIDDKGTLEISPSHLWCDGKSGDVTIEVQNMVATYALHYPEDYDGHDRWTGEAQADQPRKLNLNSLTFHLPFDKVEYEPEQFPGLIYRLDYPKVVCLIFGSGKMVITGARHKDEILEAVQIIQDELADLL